MPDLLLKIQNLSFSFGCKKIIDQLSLEINPNEIVTLLGRSGSGKTTLFKILTGLLRAQEGIISSNGLSISYMTQEDLLLPWRTVFDNLSLPFELRKTQAPKQEILKLLSQFGLENYAYAFPDQLSGGMRQRVSLARALLRDCSLLLLDEPFNSLDLMLREQIYDLLRKVKGQFNCSILMVTHDFHDALRLSDRILYMSEGTIKRSWKTEQNCPELLNELRRTMNVVKMD